MSEAKTRVSSVLVVEDHTIVRQGLVSLLSGAGLDVVGACGTGLEALRLVGSEQPDVVILDLSLPDMSGIDVIHELKNLAPACRVIVLSMHNEPEYVRPALKAGVAGYLVKGADIGDLLEAIRCAERGEVLLSPGIAKVVMEATGTSGLEQLTNRETEVLRLVAQGKTSREIALLLGISPKTVDNHRQSIMEKLGVHDAVSLTKLAIRRGLVCPE
jgi:DNA-binding NarL/FixJ family response regulator